MQEHALSFHSRETPDHPYVLDFLMLLLSSLLDDDDFKGVTLRGMDEALFYTALQKELYPHACCLCRRSCMSCMLMNHSLQLLLPIGVTVLRPSVTTKA